MKTTAIMVPEIEEIAEVAVVATYGGIVSGNVYDPKSLIEIFLIFDRFLESSPETAVHVAQEAVSTGFRVCCLEDQLQFVDDLVIPVVNRDSLGAMLLLPEKTRVKVTLGPAMNRGLSLYVCGQAKVSAIEPTWNWRILPVGKA